ncbi:MAG: hypothetical protein C4278_01010 [Patescibacteria group bacterium]
MIKLIKMIQDLWVLDFISLFLVRFALAQVIFEEIEEKLKSNFLFMIIKNTFQTFLILGFFTSFVSLILLFYQLCFFIINLFQKKFDKISLIKIALISVLIFIGPGSFSLDKALNIRF